MEVAVIHEMNDPTLPFLLVGFGVSNIAMMPKQFTGFCWKLTHVRTKSRK